MATTTFNLNLDPAISVSDYSNIYFAAFDQSGNPVPVNGQTGTSSNVISLLENGAFPSVVQATVNQGSNEPGVYPSNYFVVMQSVDSTAGDLSSILSDKTNITTANALASGYSFTLVEAVLTPSVFDQIDISALNNYGPNVAVHVNGQPAGTISSSGFKVSLQTMIDAMPAAAVQGAGTNVPMILGPNANADLWPTDVWQPYLNDLVSNPRVAAGVKSQYFFNASTLNLYQLSVQGKDENADFVLKPLFPGLPGSNTETVTVSYADLQNAIYAPTFANDANGFVKSYLVSGFDAGLWGASATYTNPHTTDTAINGGPGVAKISLSNSWNWSQLYNYEAAAAKAQGVTTISVDNVLPNATHDQYAGAIAGFGNPYGYTFSDLLAVGGVTPAPNLWTGTQDAASVDINVFANGSTPSATSNPPSGFNESPTGYLAPTTTPPNSWYYQPADDFAGAGVGNLLQIDTRLGGKYHPDANYPMTFRVYAPSSEKAGADGFVTYDLATSDAKSDPWSSWVMNSDFTITNAGTSGLDGFLFIDNVPVADGDIGWYQLVIGELGSSLQTVYDIYSTNDNGSITSFVTNPGVTVVSIEPGGDKLALAPGLVSTYNPLSYFDMNDLKAGVMYQMVLNRPTPDKEGLNHWSDFLAKGGSELAMANHMVDVLSQEQPNLSDAAFVDQLYTQGLGRDPEGEGRNWWVEQLQSGAARAQVAVDFAGEPEMWGNDTVKGVFSAAGGISTVVDWAF
ncbi:DUF4214 domain-containing protein [Orrella daihaiensis]|uniref:DUF4214 domain-containing protein n=1 Tax=Orrella daihaiensis TaxID=2782176 RepID=A0ABY4AMW1_9BURK|nr:DUF4214 domain-containing protein [Orrella daihaiensis]UOD50410.1 DUF4214 domain-containing protein [Orrella daihaiensis]